MWNDIHFADLLKEHLLHLLGTSQVWWYYRKTKEEDSSSLDLKCSCFLFSYSCLSFHSDSKFWTNWDQTDQTQYMNVAFGIHVFHWICSVRVEHIVIPSRQTPMGKKRRKREDVRSSPPCCLSAMWYKEYKTWWSCVIRQGRPMTDQGFDGLIILTLIYGNWPLSGSTHN